MSGKFWRRGERVDIEAYKQDGRPIPRMWECAENGAMEYMAINILMGNEEECNKADGERGGHPIHHAMMRGHADCVEFLVAHGASVNQPAAGTLESPLIWLAKYTHGWGDATGKSPLPDFKQMLQMGADPDQRDRLGRSAFTYALGDPTIAHTLHVRGAQPVAEDLFYAIDEGMKNGVMYLCEQHQFTIDVNERLQRGYTMKNGVEVHTPIRAAEEAGNELVVNYLLARGAEGGAAPVPKKLDYVGDNSNLGNILRKESLNRFLAAAIAPNVSLLLAAWYLPPVCGFVVMGFCLYLLNKFSSASMKSKRPEPALAGWYFGGLMCGSFVTVFQVFAGLSGPEYDTPKLAWWVVTGCMVVCYVRAMLMDPGTVVPTAQDRREVYELITKGMNIADGGCCVTTITKRPNRAKFCTTSKKLCHRFDHYCIWTCNTIAGGNHRPFMGFVIFQFFSETLVFYFGGAFVNFSSLSLFSAPCEAFDVLFNEKNIAVTYFMLIYNVFAFLFICSVLVIQTWYATRNVTSNEVWFPQRYSWCFSIGRTTYTLYDRGCLANLKEFCFGNLTNYTTELPVIENNPHLMSVVQRAGNTPIVSGQSGNDSGGCCDHGAGGHGHSHGGGGHNGHSHGGASVHAQSAPAPRPGPGVDAPKEAAAVVSKTLDSGDVPDAVATAAAASEAAAAPKRPVLTTPGGLNLTDPDSGFIYPKQMEAAILALPLATRKLMAAKQADQFAKHNMIDRESGAVKAPSAIDRARFEEDASMSAPRKPEVSYTGSPRHGAHEQVVSAAGVVSSASLRSTSRAAGAQLRSATRNRAD
eukprot:TRINITY_DN7719_c0_g1_i1.p1 TRINITY_DN7719_c0_g1~~TRINITY_DN7719_c0_g1_i1.p1  ORF type:complete len:809 (+),score=168.61 TRINITY_DN7719_c0_g1_i1:90-2516(+)